MSVNRKPDRYPATDPMVADLADHVLAEIDGATAQDHCELAQAIQQICEVCCTDIERRARAAHHARMTS